VIKSPLEGEFIGTAPNRCVEQMIMKIYKAKQHIWLGKFFIAFLVLCIFGSLLAVRTASADTREESKNVMLQELERKAGNGTQYSVDSTTGKVTSIKSTTGSIPLTKEFNWLPLGITNPQFVADQFVKEYSAYFGVADPEKDLSFFKRSSDSLGMTHLRYGQNYNGVPVFGGQIIVHLDNSNAVNSANGNIVPDISIDTSATISEQAAIEIAKALWQEQNMPADPEVLNTALYILNKSFLQNSPDDTKNYLVWEVDVYKDRPSAHEYYYIDAQEGKLIYQITGMQDVVHRHIYDCSYGDWDCYMDAFDPITGYTFGRSEGQLARGPQPYLGDSDTDNLYTILGNAHNYYATTFSRNGANNLGGVGDGSVTYPSASTTGLTYIDYYIEDFLYCPNAFFNGANSLHFCRGYVSKDITGHEYAHAVNYFSVLDGGGDPAGLTYSGEPGALNESNSDVFGEALEYAIDGSNDWLIGEDLDGGASRDMQTPSNYTYNLGSGDVPYPNRFYDTNYYCGTGDNSGVHINSSVPNHAAYLMAMGGTYNGCTITGIGRAKEEAIFYRAQTEYYTPSTNFNDAYNNLVASCSDLYGGANSADCINVIKALRSVEMNQSGHCSAITRVTPACSAPTITRVSSSKANGKYAIGSIIDIDVTFSRAVTTSGNVTVTLETGTTDRSCTFTVTNSTIGTCNYKVRAGDSTSDLQVKSITGTVSDVDGWQATSLTPASNLAANKNIVIDGSRHRSLVGFFRPSTHTFYLKNSNVFGAGYTQFSAGISTDMPLAGDWNGDGIDTVGFFRPSTHTFYLKNSNVAGAGYTQFSAGISTDIPIAGAWR